MRTNMKERIAIKHTKKKWRLYVDMDGTIARFHDVVKWLERMYERGFFLELHPFYSVVEAIRTLIKEGVVEVYVLSSCITEYSKTEKAEWLKKYLPEIKEENYIFVNVGDNKAKCIGHPLTKYDVLLDDYNLNLEEWQEAGGKSIKLVNNINDKGLFGPRWVGARVYEAEPALTTATKLKTIIME